MTEVNKIEKTCCFYASDWHLITMLLPNLIKKVNKGIRITTIAEKDLRRNIETILKKLNIENKPKIEEINWGKNKINNYEEIERKIKSNDCIIVIGNNEYIENINNKLNNILESLNKELKVINCYNIEESKEIITQIMEKHQYILNTSGEKLKEEFILEIRA